MRFKLRASLTMVLVLAIAFSVVSIITSNAIITWTRSQKCHCEPVFRPTIPENVTDIYAERLARLADACFRDKTVGQLRRVIFNKERHVAQCLVPKVACTYWTNIFRFLSNATGDKVYASPFEIPRIVTHWAPYNKIEFKLIPIYPGPPDVVDSLRFMFVREPYSRLWSAWIDKLWLPDSWLHRGPEVVKNLGLTGECRFKNVSFAEFLRNLVLDSSMKNPAILDEHWAPYREVCDPCHFRPHIIGKIETFNQDTRFILDSVNLTWILDLSNNESEGTEKVNKYTDSSLREMHLLTDYNVEMHGARLKEWCSSSNEFYHRLWTAFQYNGHLPAGVDLPVTFGDNTADEKQNFLKKAEETYLSWSGRSKDVQQQQKKKAMIEAYRLVPTDVMRKLQILYEYDFKSFDYERQPYDLYWYR